MRLNPSQHRVPTDFAKRRGLSEYAMLARIVEAGFLAMLHGTDKETDLAELAREIGAISERLAEVERVCPRGQSTWTGRDCARANRIGSDRARGSARPARRYRGAAFARARGEEARQGGRLDRR